MAKRNKGSTKNSRRAASNVSEEQRQRDKAVAYQILAYLDDVYKGDFEEQHRMSLMVMRCLEEQMKSLGIAIPTYIEHRVSDTRDDLRTDFTLCRRCEWRGEVQSDEMGKASPCTVLKLADGNVLMCCSDDGCTWGKLRKEYLK